MINKYYLPIIGQIKEKLTTEKVLQLEQFFDEETFKKLQNMTKSKFSRLNKLMEYDYYISNEKIDLNNEIKVFLEKILNKKIKNIEYKLISLTWKSYSLIHDSIDNNPEVIIDLSDWKEEYGGNIMYTDGDGNFIKIPNMKNSLIIGTTLKRFFQYCNHYGKDKKKYLIVGKIS